MQRGAREIKRWVDWEAFWVERQAIADETDTDGVASVTVCGLGPPAANTSHHICGTEVGDAASCDGHQVMGQQAEFAASCPWSPRVISARVGE